MVLDKHGPAVWRKVYRLLGNEADATDCFQEIFLEALKVSRRESIYNMGGFLDRLATVRSIDMLRRRIRERKVGRENIYLSDPEDTNPGPPVEIQRRELAVLAREAIGRLPRHEAEVLSLYYFNNMSYRQIAKSVGLQVGSVGAFLHRGRKRLREYLEKDTGKNIQVR
ncbi:MAG: RNA polymerase sigma factor [Planctomycetota bacterium]|jgi:RNA polymerase sigma-70 factor (ECF subfamily)